MRVVHVPFFQRVGQNLVIGGPNGVPGKELNGGTQRRGIPGMPQCLLQALCHRRSVLRGYQDTIAIVNQLRQASDMGRDYRPTRCKRFQDDVRVALAAAGQAENIAGTNPAGDIPMRLIAAEPDLCFHL